jgi:hypothetical protein
LTVRDALASYVRHALESLRWQELVEVEFFVVDFAEQFGDLDVHEVSMRYINVYCRQPKEGSDRVLYWLPVTRRQAARALAWALTWATAAATRPPESA